MILLKSVPYPRLLEKRKNIIMTAVTNMEKAVDAATNMVIIMECMRNMTTVTDMKMAAVTVMKRMRSIRTATNTGTAAAAAMFIITIRKRIIMSIPITYRATPMTVTASCATLMRSTVTCAARVWTNVPVKCPTSIW